MCTRQCMFHQLIVKLKGFELAGEVAFLHPKLGSMHVLAHADLCTKSACNMRKTCTATCAQTLLFSSTHTYVPKTVSRYETYCMNYSIANSNNLWLMMHAYKYCMESWKFSYSMSSAFVCVSKIIPSRIETFSSVYVLSSVGRREENLNRRKKY